MTSAMSPRGASSDRPRRSWVAARGSRSRPCGVSRRCLPTLSAIILRCIDRRRDGRSLGGRILGGPGVVMIVMVDGRGDRPGTSSTRRSPVMSAAIRESRNPQSPSTCGNTRAGHKISGFPHRSHGLPSDFNP
jgi:hypothetical protein